VLISLSLKPPIFNARHLTPQSHQTGKITKIYSLYYARTTGIKWNCRYFGGPLSHFISKGSGDIIQEKKDRQEKMKFITFKAKLVQAARDPYRVKER
jgi:hypothetical protein